MKITYNRSISGLILAVFGLLNFTSCSEDYPGNVESDKYTDLTTVRIVNAGPNGDVVLEGVIDEMKKTITFPRIDTLSDLLNLTLEAETSVGSSLEQNVFAVPYKKGETQKEIIIKVVNSPRFKEYKAIIAYDVPLFGANIESARYYDYSSNALGNPPYNGAGSIRGTGFDGEHVLIIDRLTVTTDNTHLLSVSKLKNNVIEPIPLNTAGVVGGTYSVNMGAQIHGHTYIANLSGGQTSPLKIYHWANPSDEPDLVININVAGLEGAGVRHGDNFSINIDKNGNGFAYFSSDSGKIIRVKITSFNVGSEPTVLSPQLNFMQWGHYNQIGGTEEYILSGHNQPISLVNNAASSAYTMAPTALPGALSDIKIFEFNQQRYLLGITVQRDAKFSSEATLHLFNISEGETIVDALTALEQKAVEGKTAPSVFSYNISNNRNGNPGTQAGYHILKDSSGNDTKLTIYGATFSGGFALIEFDAYEIL